MKKLLSVALLLSAAMASAQLEGGAAVKGLDDMDWKAVVSLPPGAEYALLGEDPATHGIEALVHFPRGYEAPNHSHSAAERILMVKGRLSVETEGKTLKLCPGMIMAFRAGQPHALKTGWLRGAFFLVKTDKPFDVTLMAPAPR